MGKFKLWTAAILTTTLLGACSEPQQPSRGTQPMEQDKPAEPNATEKAAPSKTEKVEVLAERLRVPWSIDFYGDTIFISEREGQIVTLKDGKLSRLPVQTAKDISAVGEGGMLGFVLTPDYPESGQAYVYHTYMQEDVTYNRIITVRQQQDSWKETKVLLENIPGSNVHNGGRMAIGPDQHLYITTGDAGEGEMSQDIDSLGGKILRMSLDGSVPDDNPFEQSYVYSYGHRNSQGLAWNEAGEMYNSEHGPSGTPGGHDEINLINPAENYGWPVLIGDEKKEGMITPLYHTGETAIAPSGITFEDDGILLVTALRGEALFRFDTETRQLEPLLEGEGRLRDVQRHEGKTYIITNNTDGRGVPSEQDDRLLLLK